MVCVPLVDQVRNGVYRPLISLLTSCHTSSSGVPEDMSSIARQERNRPRLKLILAAISGGF